MVAPIVGAGLVLVRLVGGQIVKYTSKKAAQNAIAGGGKLIQKPTQEMVKKAVTPSKLKNNPTFIEKLKAQFGIAPKQTKTMPRPGTIDQKKGIAVGKLSQTAYKRQKQIQALVKAGLLTSPALLQTSGVKKSEADRLSPFEKAFANARKKKQKTFTFNNKKYNTKTKEEVKAKK
jgi:hypothetical protein|tara:strand:+ start:139 stop:663 length:525 start_codon:yes stop_codon:yes gene_type:complete